MSDNESEVSHEQVGYEIQYYDETNQPNQSKDKYLTRDGHAHVKYPNGDEYNGTFLDLKKHGRDCTYTFASSGSSYHGDYQYNQRHGFGKFTYPDSSYYEGEFQHNQYNGQGIYKYANHDVFTGTFVAGKKNGPGHYHFAQRNETLKGTWVNDQFVSGIWASSSNDAKFIGKFNNEKPLESEEGVFIIPSSSSTATNPGQQKPIMTSVTSPTKKQQHHNTNIIINTANKHPSTKHHRHHIQSGKFINNGKTWQHHGIEQTLQSMVKSKEEVEREDAEKEKEKAKAAVNKSSAQPPLASHQVEAFKEAKRGLASHSVLQLDDTVVALPASLQTTDLNTQLSKLSMNSDSTDPNASTSNLSIDTSDKAMESHNQVIDRILNFHTVQYVPKPIAEPVTSTNATTLADDTKKKQQLKKNKKQKKQEAAEDDDGPLGDDHQDDHSNKTQIVPYHLYTCSQASITNHLNMFHHLQEVYQINRFVVVNVRSDVFLYVNDSSFTNFDKRQINKTQEYNDIVVDQLKELNKTFVVQTVHCIESNANVLKYLKMQQQQQNQASETKPSSSSSSSSAPSLIVETVSVPDPKINVKSVAVVYDSFPSEHEVDVQLIQLPLSETQTWPLTSYDSIIHLVRDNFVTIDSSEDADPEPESFGLIFMNRQGTGSVVYVSTLAAMIRRMCCDVDGKLTKKHSLQSTTASAADGQSQTSSGSTSDFTNSFIDNVIKSSGNARIHEFKHQIDQLIHITSPSEHLNPLNQLANAKNLFDQHTNDKLTQHGILECSLHGLQVYCMLILVTCYMSEQNELIRRKSERRQRKMTDKEREMEEQAQAEADGESEVEDEDPQQADEDLDDEERAAKQAEKADRVTQKKEMQDKQMKERELRNAERAIKEQEEADLSSDDDETDQQQDDATTDGAGDSQVSLQQSAKYKKYKTSFEKWFRQKPQIQQTIEQEKKNFSLQ